MYQEDPFEWLCRCLVGYVWCSVILLEGGLRLLALFVRHDLQQVRYQCKRCYLLLRLWVYLPLREVVVMWWIGWYHRQIAPWLMLLGMMPTPSWSEIEQRRKVVEAQGTKVPRWPELEAGLREEASRDTPHEEKGE